VLGVKRRKPKATEQHTQAVAAKPGAGGEYRVMTVALIREPAQLDAVEVAFSESARFYRLLRANPRFEKNLAALREAKEKRRTVHVRMEAAQSNTIRDVNA